MAGMSNKELEAKIAKYLQKANRLNTLSAQLAKIDEALAMLQPLFSAPTAGDSASQIDRKHQENQTLQDYVQLCLLHKLKFQADVLLAGVRKDLQRFQHDREQITPAVIESLMQRAQTLVEIDSESTEARELLQLLHAEYPHYAKEADLVAASLDISAYQSPVLWIEITCPSPELEKHERLKNMYQRYQVATLTSPENKSLSRLRFGLKDLDALSAFHEEFRMKATYSVTVNNRKMDEQHFSEWFQCYQQFLKANNPRYCYGASPLTFNVFGCHQLATPDVAKQLEYCWFHQGKLEPESGLFFVSAKAIATQIHHQLEHCGFCPALTQEKLRIGMLVLPKYINPECDSRWRYHYTHNERTGVLPFGNDIVIATLDTDFLHPDPATLLEVGPTPYIEKVLAYLDTNELAVLSDPVYANLSNCVHCGAPYKPHTMTCSKCRQDFGKYALRDLSNTLAHMATTKTISLAPQPAATVPAPNVEAPAPARKVSEESVSFDLLWSDPQVQQLLAGEHPAPQEKASAPEQKAKVARKIVDESRYRIPAEIAAELPPPKPTEREHELRDAVAKIAKSRPVTERSRTAPKISKHLKAHQKILGALLPHYRERKALETAFSQGEPSEPSAPLIATTASPVAERQEPPPPEQQTDLLAASLKSGETIEELVGKRVETPEQEALRSVLKNFQPRQKSDLSKRGVVRVIYHAVLDKDTCPLCAYLDGMVMDPDDPATDIFSPPLYPGCTCSREYVLKTEKPQHWPKVTFTLPPEELLRYLDKKNQF